MRKIISVLLILSVSILLFSCYNNDYSDASPENNEGTNIAPPTDDNTNNGDNASDPWADYIDDPNDAYMDGGAVKNYPFGKEINTETIDSIETVEVSLYSFYFATVNPILNYNIKIENGCLWVANQKGESEYHMLGELQLVENINLDGDNDFQKWCYDKAYYNFSSLGQLPVLYSWEAFYRIQNAPNAYIVDVESDPISGRKGKWVVYLFDGVYYALQQICRDDGSLAVRYFGVGIEIEDFYRTVPFNKDIKTEIFEENAVYSSTMSYGDDIESSIYNIRIENGILYANHSADGNGEFYNWGNIVLKKASAFAFNERLVLKIKSSFFGGPLENQRVFEIRDAFIAIRRCSTVYIATRADDVPDDIFPYEHLAIYMLGSECYIFGVSVDDTGTITYEKLYVTNTTE